MKVRIGVAFFVFLSAIFVGGSNSLNIGVSQAITEDEAQIFGVMPGDPPKVVELPLSDDVPFQNFTIPPQPIRIVDVSVSPKPQIAEVSTLHIEFVSKNDEPDTSLLLELPEGIELVRGSTIWHGSLSANQVQSHELTFRLLREGDWRFNIEASAKQSNSGTVLDEETLHIVSVPGEVFVIPGSQYTILQPPGGMPSPEISREDFSASYIAPDVLGTVTIRATLRFDALQDDGPGAASLVTNQLKRVRIELWDYTPSGERELADMTYVGPPTYRYQVTVANVDEDNNPGIDPFLKIYSEDGSRVEVVDYFDDHYVLNLNLDPIIGHDLADGVYPFTYTYPATSITQALYLFDKTADDSYEYLQTKVAWGNTDFLRIYWPVGCLGLPIQDACFFGDVFIPETWQEEPDVVIHEYGHFVLSRYITEWNVTQACAEQNYTHAMWEETGLKCAWSEGWATFFEMAVQNDADYIDDKLDDHNHIPPPGDPEKIEGIVAATLWDFFDGANESFDAFADNFNGPAANGIWHFSTFDPPGIQNWPLTIPEFWNDRWLVDRPSGACFGSAILQYHELDYPPIARTLTISSLPPAGGTTSVDTPPNCPENKYADGTFINMTAHPAPGYAFSHWSGSFNSTSNPVGFSINRDKLFRANFVLATATPTPTNTSTPTATSTPTPTGPTPTPTILPSGLWAAPPVSLAQVPSNSQITILSVSAFRAQHFAGNWWMGGGVFAEALPGETPIGVIFTWNSDLEGKRMCEDLEFGPTVDAEPCAFAGNTSDQLTAGIYCHAHGVAGMTSNEVCQQLANINTLGGIAFEWLVGETTRGFGWEQRGNLGSPGAPEFTVENILLIYHTSPTPTPTTCNPCLQQTPQPPNGFTSTPPSHIYCPGCNEFLWLTSGGILVSSLTGLTLGYIRVTRRDRSKFEPPN